MRRKAGRLLCAWCGLLLALPSAALAHRVYLFARDENGQVCSQAYYSKTAKIAEAEITVHDTDGREMLRGRSDSEGRFCFARPGSAPLLLVVDAGQGHRGEFALAAKTPTSPAAADSAGVAIPQADGNEPGLRQILEGLGWIAGLAVLLAWYKTRSGFARRGMRGHPISFLCF